jgi:ribulose-5-phosphate 4-epimerase/fuculose-1-phosphate aldolase
MGFHTLAYAHREWVGCPWSSDGLIAHTLSLVAVTLMEVHPETPVETPKAASGHWRDEMAEIPSLSSGIDCASFVELTL